MSTQTEREAVEKLLGRYAQVLNSADTASIPSYYTADGQFMPEGLKTTTSSELKRRGEDYFRGKGFQIGYSVQNMVVDGRYAFVQATAQTVATDLKANKEALHTSQDFFVLRKEQEEWKIFRYTFNNVKEQ
ncbi:hypothetical protein DXT99_04840 [Pontibacter diazotrophicus]|uniref:SnoaL-like domain-containing protein n=1 Tax=Pontibacter diazotrophicus TaxID=1400979 RepID=A0A3D8LGH5_9BACT|nr:nuclear transport factor 2 family protein [Pontibacter diazotrophicus]RDV16523.1 hypothetical protein DXT99_04840 [Pontibacter diazotrophicus]